MALTYTMLAQLLGSMASIGLVDWFCKPIESARWFFLHVFINTIVVLTSIMDVLACLMRPMICFTQEWSSSLPIMMIFAGHVYHMLFFNNLKRADWEHHIPMIFVVIPVAVWNQPYIGTNLAGFGLSGLPGGIDYLLLTLVKYGKIDKMTEKKWNVIIHTWMRMPILVVGFGFWLTAFMEGFVNVWTAICGLLTYWNAIYYQHDVLMNYYSKHYRRQLEN